MVEPVLNLKNKKPSKPIPKETGAEVKIRKEEHPLKDSADKKHSELSWNIRSLDDESGPGRLYVISGLIFIIAVVLIFTLKEYTFSIFLMVLSITALVMRHKNPSISHIKIHHYGIDINDQHHPYRELKSFYVVYEPRGLKELSIQAKSWYLPIIRIPIEPGNSPLVIRNHLIEYLPEVEHPVSLADVIIKRLGI